MEFRQRITNCKHLTMDEVRTLVKDYMVGRFELGGQHGAAVQYYLRHFLYLPYSVIAEVFGRKPWHVRQTIERMEESATDARVPVTMNEDYQRHIESFDDYCRDRYGVCNVELGSLTNYLEVDYLMWQSQKAVGCYEENSSGEEPQFNLWTEALGFANVQYTDEVVYTLCEMYTITKNA